MEMSKTEEIAQHYNFIVVGGGIAGVTCVETVSFSLNTENSYSCTCSLYRSFKLSEVQYCVIP